MTGSRDNDGEEIMIYLELFSTFFLIGMFTIGGGYAMLSLIQIEVVTVHGWIDDGTFTDIVAISQMTPGPIGINSATYIGYEVLNNSGASEFMCILGSFTATFAVVLPSFLIVLWICKIYDRYKHHYMFQGIMSGLKPATLGLIGTAQLYFKLSVIGKKLVVQNVHDLVAVDGNNSVADADLAAERAGLIHRFYKIILHAETPLSNHDCRQAKMRR